MTEKRYTRGPSFLEHLQRYTSNGCSLAEAKQRLLRRINAGEFVVNKTITLTLPVLHLELASRDRLFFVTATERVDVSDVFTLVPMREQPALPLLGSPVPMSDAVFEKSRLGYVEPGLIVCRLSRQRTGVEPEPGIRRYDKSEPTIGRYHAGPPARSVSKEPNQLRRPNAAR